MGIRCDISQARVCVTTVFTSEKVQSRTTIANIPAGAGADARNLPGPPPADRDPGIDTVSVRLVRSFARFCFVTIPPVYDVIF